MEFRKCGLKMYVCVCVCVCVPTGKEKAIKAS